MRTLFRKHRDDVSRERSHRIFFSGNALAKARSRALSTFALSHDAYCRDNYLFHELNKNSNEFCKTFAETFPRCVATGWKRRVYPAQEA